MISVIFIRVRNPDTVLFTWRSFTPFKQRRLDLFLISDSLHENIELVEIIPSVQSDHSVVKIKLCSSKENARGPSHWKCNNSLVNDRQFVDLLRAEIPRYKLKPQLSMRWEFVKYKCGEFPGTIPYKNPKNENTGVLRYIKARVQSQYAN